MYPEVDLWALKDVHFVRLCSLATLAYGHSVQWRLIVPRARFLEETPALAGVYLTLRGSVLGVCSLSLLLN